MGEESEGQGAVGELLGRFTVGNAVPGVPEVGTRHLPFRTERHRGRSLQEATGEFRYP